MSLAYFILAHKSPPQVERLLRSLWHADDTFVLHFDARGPRELHELGDKLARRHPNILLLRPRKILWGGHQQVTVVLDAIDAALESGRPWSHFINLSGQDYPLKSRDHVLRCLNPAHTYISWFEPLANPLWGNARERLVLRHLHWPWLHALLAIPGLGRRIRRPLGWANRIPFIPFYRRPVPDFFRYFGGSYHLTLNREACAYLGQNASARRIYRWLKVAGHPDEITFQSILLNSPLASTVQNHDLREIDFPLNSPHPKIWAAKDFPRLATSQNLWARKFDPAVDAHILDLLDAQFARAASP